MPLTKEEIRVVRAQAFKEAADLLERTATDFQQCVNELGSRQSIGTRRGLIDKIQLLMGQSIAIKKLK